MSQKMNSRRQVGMNAAEIGVRLGEQLMANIKNQVVKGGSGPDSEKKPGEAKTLSVLRAENGYVVMDPKLGVGGAHVFECWADAAAYCEEFLDPMPSKETEPPPAPDEIKPS